MRRLTKFGIIAAGLLGVSGYFAALVSIGHPTIEQFQADVSAHRLVLGISDIRDHVANLDGLDAAQTAEVDVAVATLNSELAEVRVVFVAIFVPAAIVFLVGLLGLFASRFGRGLGSITLLASLATLAIYGFMRMVVTEAGQQTDEATVVLGTGALLLLVSGALGAAFSVAALIAPERTNR